MANYFPKKEFDGPKLAWQNLDPLDGNLPKNIAEASATFLMAQKALIKAVEEGFPCKPGKRWIWSWKQVGKVAIAKGDTSSAGSTNYFS